MVFRNFLGNNFFSGRTPTGWKRRFSGILARFGLRAHMEDFNFKWGLRRRVGARWGLDLYPVLQDYVQQHILP